MKIYIEVLVLLTVIFFLFVAFLWIKFTGWRLRRKYNPNDNKSRKGEINAGAVRETESVVRTTIDDSFRPEQSERGQLLPSSNVSNVRTHRPGIRRILRRTRTREWAKIS